MPYAIVILLILLAGAGTMLKNQYEVTGEQQAELAQQAEKLEFSALELAETQSNHVRGLQIRDQALSFEQTARREAEHRSQNAETRLSLVEDNACYDAAIPDSAAIGVQQAFSTFTGSPMQIGDPRNPAPAGRPTCRDLANYFPRVVNALEQANTQLRAAASMPTN